MATFNRSHLILETLASIKNQTFKNWECLIIDDGSVDNTAAVIRPILKKDKRFKFLNRPDSYNKQIPGCRNFGLDIAKGDYIIFFDDDDIVHPQNLQICVRELRQSRYKYCRYTREVFRNKFHYDFNYSSDYSSVPIHKKDLFKVVNNTLQFNSCQVMWRRECFENLRFDERLYYAEEWECYLRILVKPITGININKVLFYGRKHDNSNTGEFYEKNNQRFTSYKKAILLVAENLEKENMFSLDIFKYLIGISISHRDRKLMHCLMRLYKSELRTTTFFKLKFIVFPLTKKLKKIFQNQKK